MFALAIAFQLILFAIKPASDLSRQSCFRQLIRDGWSLNLLSVRHKGLLLWLVGARPEEPARCTFFSCLLSLGPCCYG